MSGFSIFEFKHIEEHEYIIKILSPSYHLHCHGLFRNDQPGVAFARIGAIFYWQ